MFRSVARHWQVLALVASAVACGGGQDAAKIPLSGQAAGDRAGGADTADAALGADAQAALDSANAYFRAKQYARALERYRTAARLAPRHSAPLFGLYMVAQATSDATLADSVLTEMKKRGSALPPAVHDVLPDSSVANQRRKAAKGLPGA